MDIRSDEIAPETTDLTSVRRSDAGLLVATQIETAMCACGQIALRGIDKDGRCFVAMPIAPQVAYDIAVGLLELAQAGMRRRGGGLKHKH